MKLMNIILLQRVDVGLEIDLILKTIKHFHFDFPGLVTTQPISLKVYVAVASSSQSAMQVHVNGNAVSTLSIAGATEPIMANGASFVGNVNVNSSKIDVNLNFDNLGNPSALGYLDYISVEGTQSFKFFGNHNFNLKIRMLP